MERWDTFLGKTSDSFWLVSGTTLLYIVGALDYVTGTELSFSLFYLIPIVLFSWALKGNAGFTAALFSTILWFVIELLTNTNQLNILVHLWNAITRLGFFLFPVLLLKNLRKEKSEAKTDFLTGAFNNRFFHEVLLKERDRFARYQHPYTIAFIDLDNFKSINDTFGHTFGDTVLRGISDALKQNLRKTDIVARMGGDEFAILLLETGPEAAKTTISHMQEKLRDNMLKNKWPVTFSIGVLTLTNSNIPIDEILGTADKAMYLVKNNGKNNIQYATR